MSSDEPRADSTAGGTADADPAEPGYPGETGVTGETADADDFDAEGDLGDLGEDWESEPLDAEPAPGAGPRILAILLGLLLALAGAAAWGALTMAVERRFALLAVVFGILIGLVVRRVGKISGIVGGLVAAVLSLFSAGLGQFVEGYLLQTKAINEAPVVDALHQDWTVFKQWEEWGFSRGWEVFTKNLGGLSWLTLLLAAAAAYIFASDSGKRKPKVTEDEEPLEGFDPEEELTGEYSEYGEADDVAEPAEEPRVKE